MSVKSPAYVISADSHSAELFRQAAQSMIAGTGVVGTADYEVTQKGTADMSVEVAAGMIWVPGTLGATSGFAANRGAQTGYGLASDLTSQGAYAVFNDGSVDLTISAADSTNDRIDLVCVTVEDSEYSGSNDKPVLQIITGTAAASPDAPDAPDSSVVLAEVSVPANASSITTSDITDVRPILSLAGPQGMLCPPGTATGPSLHTASTFATSLDVAATASVTVYANRYYRISAFIPSLFSDFTTGAGICQLGLSQSGTQIGPTVSVQNQSSGIGGHAGWVTYTTTLTAGTYTFAVRGWCGSGVTEISLDNSGSGIIVSIEDLGPAVS